MQKQKTLLALVAWIALSAGYLTAQTTPVPALTAEPTTQNLAPPEHPATAEQVTEYLTLVNYVQTAHRAVGQMLNAARATSAPYYTASFWDDIQSAVLEIDLITPNIPAYQKYFSQEDMAATIAFYKSPAGRRLLEAQPLIVSVSSDILRKAGETAGTKVGLKHKDEIEALMKKSQPNPVSPPVPDKPSR